MRKLMFILLLLLVPIAALAQTPMDLTATSTTTLIEDPGMLIGAITAAFGDKNWMTLAGLLLTGLIGLARLFGLQKLIPKRHTHWLAGGLALAGSVAAGLMVHASVWTILTTAVGVGVTAVGGWVLILEPIRNFVRKKLGGEPAPEPMGEKPDDGS